MSKRNPYRAIERAARKVGNVLLIVFYCLAVAAVLLLLGSMLWEDAGWGWWSLTIIVIAPAGLALIGLAVALGYAVVDGIETRWRHAKYRWDNTRAQEHESQGSGS